MHAGSTPKLHELQLLESDDGNRIRIIEEVAAKWKFVATALGFGAPRIDSIELDSFCKVEHACFEIFVRWLNGEHDLRTPITWMTLIKCLKEARLDRTADKLQQLLQKLRNTVHE